MCCLLPVLECLVGCLVGCCEKVAAKGAAVEEEAVDAVEVVGPCGGGKAVVAAVAAVEQPVEPQLEAAAVATAGAVEPE